MSRRRGFQGSHPRLFWRVYAYGVVMLLTVAVASIGVSHLFDMGPPWREAAARMAGALTADLGTMDFEQPDGRSVHGLERRLGLLHDALEASLGVYTIHGRRLAVGGTAPEPLSADELKRLQSGEVVQRRAEATVALGLGERAPFSAYVIAEFPPLGHASERLLLFLALSLAVSALVMWPLAHGIARPLERVARTARALGRGDLAARTGVRRRDEIGALAASFDDMADRIQRLIRSEKELLANVSHELRTPLARLVVALELCEDEADAGVLRQQIAGMAGDVRDLDQLVDQVLATARLDLLQGDGEAGLTLRREPVDLAALVERSASRFATRHPHDRLRTAVEASLPSIDGDPSLLARALDNLVENAAKHGRRDDRADIEIVVGRTEAGMSGAGLSETGIALEVRDRGPGVPEEDVARLFDPFFQTDRSRSGAARGLGLGLALCRRVAEAHGGTIEAANRDGGGLRVRLTLPTGA